MDYQPVAFDNEQRITRKLGIGKEQKWQLNKWQQRIEKNVEGNKCLYLHELYEM